MTQQDRHAAHYKISHTSWSRQIAPTLLTLVLLKHINSCYGGGGVPKGSPVYALLIIDVQYCFTSTGTLPVPEGDDVIAVINDIRLRYRSNFNVVALTQDWHCADHVSFASQHQGREPFERIDLTYIKSTGDLCRNDVTGTTSPYAVNCSGSTEPTVTVPQELWPDHCVKGTQDARIHPGLFTDQADIIVQKGFRCQIDSYSAFYDNGRINITSLHKDLTDRGVTDLFTVGLATDFCVFYSSLDAKELGYRTWVILDATRGITKEGTEKAVNEMTNKDIKVINSADLDGIFNKFNSSGRRFTWTTCVLIICINCLITLSSLY